MPQFMNVDLSSGSRRPLCNAAIVASGLLIAFAAGGSAAKSDYPGNLPPSEFDVTRVIEPAPA